VIYDYKVHFDTNSYNKVMQIKYIIKLNHASYFKSKACAAKWESLLKYSKLFNNLYNIKQQ